MLHAPTLEEQVLLKDLVYTSEQIETRAKELAQEINKDFGHIDYLVCIMDGAFHWTNLLAPLINFSTRLNTSLSFYNSTEIRLSTDFLLENSDFTNKKILVVEDIVSKGRTLDYVLGVLQKKSPQRLSVCSLVDKPCNRLDDYSHVSKRMAYVGFETTEILMGYGMALPELPTTLRHLKNIYSLQVVPDTYFERISKKVHT